MLDKSLILLASLTLSLTLSLASADPTPTPTAKPRRKGHDLWITKTKGSRSVQVKVDPVRKGVDVSLTKDEETQLPRSIEFKYTDSLGKQNTMELKTMESENLPGQYHGDLSGSLSGGEQSVTGFELRIPFGSNSPTVLKSEDMDNP